MMNWLSFGTDPNPKSWIWIRIRNPRSFFTFQNHDIRHFSSFSGTGGDFNSISAFYSTCIRRLCKVVNVIVIMKRMLTLLFSSKWHVASGHETSQRLSAFIVSFTNTSPEVQCTTSHVTVITLPPTTIIQNLFHICAHLTSAKSPCQLG